jgi:biotin carboxyl carrier protein
MAVTTPGPVRVTVEDVTSDLVLDLEPDELEPADAQGVTILERPASSEDLRAGRRHYEVVVDGWSFTVSVEPAQRARLRDLAVRAHGGADTTAAIIVRAQLPGRVVRVFVAPGDTVESGQRLLAIEAMKMENEVRAPRGGTVRRVDATVGSAVDPGDELARIE